MKDLAERVADVVAGLDVPPVMALIGFRFRSIGDGSSVTEFDAEARHANPMGSIHGGVLCDVADAGMGMAHASTLAPGESFTTLDLKINFVRPFWTGRLVATARTVSRGRTVSLLECDIVDDQGRLVARASSTCMTLRGDAAKGR